MLADLEVAVGQHAIHRAVFAAVDPERKLLLAVPRRIEVWVQYDGTNRPVAEELVREGIPRSAIVLGFHPPHVRALTGFAAA